MMFRYDADTAASGKIGYYGKLFLDSSALIKKSRMNHRGQSATEGAADAFDPVNEPLDL
jgi:hypothetical protein